MRWCLGLALCLSVTLGLAGPSRAAAPRLSTVTASPTGIAGHALAVQLRATGSGRVRVALLLSRDRRRSRDDLSLGSVLVRAAKRPRSVHARVPRTATARLSYLLACPAGSRSCRVASRRVAILGKAHPLTARPRAGGVPVVTRIGPGGGTIAGGSPRITLTVPAGALVGSHTLALQPLSSVGVTLPGRVLGAALLKPEGLVLGNPGHVTIARRANAAVAFGAGGRDVHLVPITSGIALTRLGGVAFLSATPAALARFAKAHVASDDLDELLQLVALRKSATHAVLAKAAADPNAELLAYLFAVANTMIASNDIDSAMAQYQLWDPIAASLIGRAPEVIGLRSLVRGALQALALHRLFADSLDCTTKHDLSVAGHIGRVGGYGAFSPTTLGDIEIEQRARDYLDGCLRFAVHIDARLADSGQQTDSFGDVGQQQWSYELTADVPVTDTLMTPSLDFTTYAFNGAQQSEYKSITGSASFSDGTCVVSQLSPGPGQGWPFTVASLGLQFNADQPGSTISGGKLIPPVTFAPLIEPGLPTETVNIHSQGEDNNNGVITCTDGGQSTAVDYGWRGLFSTFHAADAVPSDNPGCPLYRLPDLTYHASDTMLADATYTRSGALTSFVDPNLLTCNADPVTVGGIDFDHLSGTETTNVKIVHCPRGLPTGDVEDICKNAGLT